MEADDKLKFLMAKKIKDKKAPAIDCAPLDICFNVYGHVSHARHI